MKTKNYEAPETEVVVVRIERAILSLEKSTKGNSFASPKAVIDDQSDDEGWGW